MTSLSTADAPNILNVERRACWAASALWRQAGALDVDGADPRALCQPLVDQDLFTACLPIAHGGEGLASEPFATDLLRRVLQTLGAGNLSAGRIFEGHVNALKLLFRYGSPDVQRAVAADVRAGAICGVWNAERPPGVTIDAPLARGARSAVLSGGKIFASGLGLVDRPLVTARTTTGQLLILAPRLTDGFNIDLNSWRPRGMRASATGTIDLTGTRISQEDLIGGADDYYRSPLFKGGAWRFAAVQSGAVKRLAFILRQNLRQHGRDNDPHQRARIATASLSAQTAELWVKATALAAEDLHADPAQVDAAANLCRAAVERAAMEVVSLAERSLGLSAFMRPDPADRLIRDLTTYLRQPMPDAALDEAAAYLLAREPADDWDAEGGIIL